MIAKKVSLVAATGALLALAGCPGVKVMEGGPPRDDTDIGCHSTTMRCVVLIKANDSKPCGFEFRPDPLKVNPRFKDFAIVWKLPSGYEFRDGDDVGDGITFPKNPTKKQFYDRFATDKPDGSRPTSGSTAWPNYHWTNKNTEKGDYLYTVQFRKHDSDTPIVCDPTISNLSDQ